MTITFKDGSQRKVSQATGESLAGHLEEGTATKVAVHDSLRGFFNVEIADIKSID